MSYDHSSHLSSLVELALQEDAAFRDVTTRFLVDDGKTIGSSIIAKERAIVAGLEAAREVYRQVDPEVQFQSRKQDGDEVGVGEVCVRLTGRARSIFAGERTALNFLQHLSGVATLTRRYVDLLSSFSTQVLDTRKTTPGFRGLEKEAVRAAGGQNHRMDLASMVLVKRNHILLSGGITPALTAAHAKRGNLAVEIEVQSFEEAKEAVGFGVDRLMLDNMEPESMREVMEWIQATCPPDRRPEVEASGNMTSKRARAAAEAGVDFVSVGALTHSAPASDIHMVMDEPGNPRELGGG